MEHKKNNNTEDQSSFDMERNKENTAEREIVEGGKKEERKRGRKKKIRRGRGEKDQEAQNGSDNMTNERKKENEKREN